MKSLYQHKEGQPFHISVDVVLVNEEGKICVHKKIIASMPEKWVHILGGLKEIYTLMRETVENGEMLEEAVRRGLQEEFGAEAEVEKYLGSLTATILTGNSEPWQKTTLYFSARLINQGPRSMDDDESHSLLEWLDPAFLIEKMSAQGRDSNREDLDESMILKAYVKYK